MNAKALASYSRWHGLRHEFWSLVSLWAFSKAFDASEDAATVAARAEAMR